MTFTGTMLKNLFSRPVTKNYPAEPAVYPERSRGHIEISIDDCISCGLCVRSCPTGTISVDKKAGSWTINRFDCIACGYCVEKCPKKCLHMVPGYQEPMGEKAEAIYRISPEVMAERAAKAAEAAKKAAAAKAAKAAAARAKAEAEAKTDAAAKAEEKSKESAAMEKAEVTG
ncbi:MAG: 4Fe-4S binding protein [Eubacterium sp.]|nr:4Fe-4S binding protein [Eubacterium sp.]